MKDKNCPNCKFYKRGEIRNIYSNAIPSHCTNGHNDIMTNWWKDNGNKTDRNTLTELECFEDTDAGKCLNNAINALDKMIKKLE